MSRPYRFALIGCGFFAQNHLQAWAEMSDVELVATCDINPDSAVSAAETFGVRSDANATKSFTAATARSSAEVPISTRDWWMFLFRLVTDRTPE